MTIRDLIPILDAKVLCGEERLDEEVCTACGSDLMSDVLAYVKDQAVLLTGLLNSKLAAYWFKSKGKMQGANYQLDKEPLQQIPIAVPSNDIQELIAKLVDMIILLNTTDMRASELVQNSYISSELERLIDGCIYEIYLPDEMAGMSVTTILRNYIKPKDTICINDIGDLYMKIDSTGIIESLNSLSLSNSEALRTIILS